MKDKHAQTHVFTIHVSNYIHFEAVPIADYEHDNGPIAGKVPNVFDAVRNECDADGQYEQYDTFYVTPDYTDALFALFVMVDREIIDPCSANDAAMMFTEAFYGFKTE